MTKRGIQQFGRSPAKFSKTKEADAMSKSTDQRPNILLIVTDHHRGDCLGVAGHPVLQTPNLDGIAAQGTRFTQAYSPCPSCIAARRSILTGQSPSHHGLVGFQDGVEWDPPATLPGLLSRAGYQTFLAGRTMHQHPFRKRYGFDHMVANADVMESPASSLFDFNGHGIGGNSWVARPWHEDEKRHPTYVTSTIAVRFLQTWRDPSCPFFLVVNYDAPHPPLCPPAFYMERYLRMPLPEPAIGDWAEMPPEGERGFDPNSDRVCLRGEALRSCHAAFYGLINHIDDQLYRVLTALGTNPLTGHPQLDNTLIIFTSDHGEMLGDHHLFRKTYPYDGSARIPFLIRPTKAMGMSRGQVCDAPVCLEDLMPTILDAAGVKIPDSVDGRSLLPLMRGKQEGWREFLHGEHAACYRLEQANHYLTDGRWKYAWFSHTGQERLFHLAEDPRELHDLSGCAEHAQTLALWRGRLVGLLRDRPEGFSDGQRLVAGRPHLPQVPHAPRLPVAHG